MKKQLIWRKYFDFPERICDELNIVLRTGVRLVHVQRMLLLDKERKLPRCASFIQFVFEGSRRQIRKAEKEIDFIKKADKGEL